MQENKKDRFSKSERNIGMDKNEEMEDVTKYGEFVSSYFAWIPLPKQKERAEELDKMTKKNRRE